MTGTLPTARPALAGAEGWRRRGADVAMPYPIYRIPEFDGQIETLRRLKYRPTGGFCQFFINRFIHSGKFFRLRDLGIVRVKIGFVRNLFFIGSLGDGPGKGQQSRKSRYQ